MSEELTMHEAVTRRLPEEARAVIEALDATHFSALVDAVVTELHIRGDKRVANRFPLRAREARKIQMTKNRVVATTGPRLDSLSEVILKHRKYKQQEV